MKKRKVIIRTYQPNKVILEVGEGPPGILVLTDIYYPGWICEIGGESQPLYRANYLFRGVPVGEGKQVVTLSFWPTSLERGRNITLGTLGLILIVLLAAGIGHWGRFGLSGRSSSPANEPGVP